jgi:hypothetical protein
MWAAPSPDLRPPVRSTPFQLQDERESRQRKGRDGQRLGQAKSTETRARKLANRPDSIPPVPAVTPPGANLKVPSASGRGL